MSCAKGCGQEAQYSKPESLCVYHWSVWVGEEGMGLGASAEHRDRLAAAAVQAFLVQFEREIREEERRSVAEYEVELNLARSYGHARAYLGDRGFVHCLDCDQEWHGRQVRAIKRCEPKAATVDDQALENIVRDALVPGVQMAIAEPLLSALKRLAKRAHTAGVQLGRRIAAAGSAELGGG